MEPSLGHSELNYMSCHWNGIYSSWCHQMKIFSTLLTLCEGDLLVTSGFPSQRPVTLSFDVFFDLHLNKQWDKQSRCQWFETPLHLLLSHCNVLELLEEIYHVVTQTWYICNYCLWWWKGATWALNRHVWGIHLQCLLEPMPSVEQNRCLD